MEGEEFKEVNQLPKESAEELYENAPCGYVSFRNDGSIYKINQTLLSWLGYEQREVVNKMKVQQLFKIGGQIYFETHFFPLIKMQGFVNEVNFEMVRKDRSTFPGLINVREISSPETPVKVYRAMIFDITDRKKYEQELILAKQKAEKISRAKADLLSTISHEIRTPLNAIIGVGNLFKRSRLNKVQKEYSRILLTSAENLLGLVNNLLDLSKIEARKVKLEERSFSLSNLVDSILMGLRLRADEKKIRLFYEPGEGLPDHFFGDPIKISQILTNLLGNAIKFTNEGYVKLEIKVQGVEKNRIRLEFRVSDTGIGIPKDKLEDIFQEFSQASYEVNLQYGGTGLGLTISQKLLKLFGSTMKVESLEGLGSVFSFDLWLRTALERPAPPIKPKPEPRPLRNLRVLVVDDTPFNLYITSQYLELWKVKVETAESGALALEALKNKEYDMVLMDLQMPKMSGYQAAVRIRRLALERQPVIIAFSASGRGDLSKKLEKSGIDDHLIKPFTPEELMQALLRNLAARKERKGTGAQKQALSKNPAAQKPKENGSIKISRFLDMAQGNPHFLGKFLKNTIKALEEYRKEFAEAVNSGDRERFGALKHRGTMTFYYIQAEKLMEALEELSEQMNKEKINPVMCRAILENLLAEFDKAIEELRSLKVEDLLGE